MAASRRKAAKKAVAPTTIMPSSSDALITKENTGQQVIYIKGGEKNANEVTALAQHPQQVFQKFSTKTKLEEGLFMVQKMGTGRYKAVNLSKVDMTTLGSKEVGKAIKGSAEYVLINSINAEIESVKSKVNVLADNSNDLILRLFNLPIEIREMIFKEVILTNSRLQRRRSRYLLWDNAALPLMLSCVQIYNQCIPIFYSNTFELKVADFPVFSKSSTFKACVTDIRFVWKGFKNDARMFAFLVDCPRLQTLRFVLPRYAAPSIRGHIDGIDEEDDVEEVFPIHGIKNLLKIRGLKRVEFDSSIPPSKYRHIPDPGNPVTLAARKLYIDRFAEELRKIIRTPRAGNPKEQVWINLVRDKLDG